VPLSIAVVSWIDEHGLVHPDPRAIAPPWLPGARFRKTLWFARTVYALLCTANPMPPARFAERAPAAVRPFLKRQREEKRTLAALRRKMAPLFSRDGPLLGWLPRGRGVPAGSTDIDTFAEGPEFRFLLYTSFTAEIDAARHRVLRVVPGSEVCDEGWTRPFDFDRCPDGAGAAGEGNFAPFDEEPHRGEKSPLSGFYYFPRRHPNSAITAGPDEQPVASGLIKARAGPVTDGVGVREAHTPYHVPWVWSEFLLTYRAGQFRLHGLGSEFPSHCYYVNDRRVALVPQIADPVLLTRPEGLGEEIDLERMNLYRVLRRGSPAFLPQPAPPLDAAAVGPVTGHEHTAGEGKPALYSWPGP
jgi:hypothetical protein